MHAKNRFVPTLKFVGICVIAAFVMSCAALNIGVDVYKGPMVDDIDVQTEQTAVMAMGAKPLLIQLRNRLEEKAFDKVVDKLFIKTWRPREHAFLASGYRFHNCTEDNLSMFQKKKYIESFIIDNNGFCSEQAHRVNAVLSLYENLNRGPLSIPVIESQKAIDGFNEGSGNLSPSQEKKDELQKKWETVVEGLRDEYRIDPSALPPRQNQETAEKFNEEIEAILELPLLLNPDLLKGINKLTEFSREHDLLEGDDISESLNRVKAIPTVGNEKNRDAKHIPIGEYKSFHKSVVRLTKLNMDLSGDTSGQWFRSFQQFDEAKKKDLKDAAHALIKAYDHFLTYLGKKLALAYKTAYGAGPDVQVENISYLHQAIAHATNGREWDPKYSDWKEPEALFDDEDSPKLENNQPNDEFCPNPKSGTCFRTPSSATSVFSFFRNADHVKMHANLLFKPGEQKKDFGTQVISHGNAYHEVHESLRTLYRNLLDINLILALDGNKKLKDQHSMSVNEIITRFTRMDYLFWAYKNTEYLTDREKLSYQNLTTLIKNIKDEMAAIEPRENLTALSPKATELRRIGDQDLHKIQKLKGKLFRLLNADPAGVALALREADLVFVQSASSKDYRPQYGISERYSAGAHYMSTSKDVEKVATDISKLSRQFSSVGGFEKGRLDPGLEDLIEDYLDAVHKGKTSMTDIDTKRDALFNSLLRFAEKVLFVANNQAFFGKEDKWYRGEIEYFSDDLTKKYTRVLQAVGNSIHNQIDEIRHHDKYTENINKSGPRERLAMKVAFPKYATEAIDQLIASLDAQANIPDETILSKDDKYQRLVKELKPLKEALDVASKEVKAKLKIMEDEKKIFDPLYQNSGYFFQTVGGKTTGGTILGATLDPKKGPNNLDIVGNFGTATSNKKTHLVIGNLGNTHIVTGGTYKGGTTTASTSVGKSPSAYGGVLSDLMIEGGTTTGGTLIGGNLKDAKFSISSEKATISGTNVNLQSLQSFKGKVGVDGDNAIVIRLQNGKGKTKLITNLSKQDGTSIKTEDILNNVHIKGKIGDITVLGKVLECGDQEPSLQKCLITDGTLEKVSIEQLKISEGKITSLNFENDFELNSIELQSLDGIKLKGLTVNDSELIGKIGADSSLTGTINFNDERGKEITGIKYQDTLKIETAILTQLKGEMRFKLDKDASATFGKQKKPIAITLTDSEGLNLANTIIENAWIQGGVTKLGDKLIIKGDGQLTSGATLKDFPIPAAKVSQFQYTGGKLTGKITKDIKLPLETKTVGGITSGGILTGNTIRNSTRMGDIKTEGATIKNATIQVVDNGPRVLIQKGHMLDKGTIIAAKLMKGTLEKKVESPGGVITGVTIKDAIVGIATIRNATIKGNAGGVIENAQFENGHFKGVTIKDATIVDIVPQDDHKQVMGFLTKGIISNGTLSQNAGLIKGTVKGVDVFGVKLKNGVVKEGITKEGQTKFADFFLKTISEDSNNKDKFAEFIVEIIAKITSAKTTVGVSNVRKEQLTSLETLLQKANEISLADKLQKESLWANTTHCSGEMKCTHRILGHLLLLHLRDNIGLVKTNLENTRIVHQTSVASETAAKEKHQNKVRELEARKTTVLQKHKGNSKTARDTVVLHHKTILDRLAKKDQLTSSQQVYAEILGVLEEAKKQEAEKKPNTSSPEEKENAEKKSEMRKPNPAVTALQTTISIVKKRPVNLHVPMPANVEDLNAKQVMDQLVTTLKYEHILAVRDGGKDSALAQNIEQAMKAAYDHRAGMVHIRPALAFLRSSYPATALQEEPPLHRKNMLFENAWKSTAIFGDAISWLGNDGESYKIQAQIDKQFWHNVNTIRLNAGGDTNYVVMKDDIGNWTVKNYSADPGDIIRSAKNLAMFALGSGMGQNLLAPNQVTNIDGVPGTGNVPEGNQLTGEESRDQQKNPTLLSRQFEKFKALHAKQSQEQLQNIQTLTREIKEKIETRWNSEEVGKIISDLSPILETSQDSHLSVLPDQSNIAEGERGSAILDRLNGIKRFHNQAKGDIAKKGNAQDKDSDKKIYIKANRLMTSVVKNELLKILGQRQSTVSEFKTQVTVLQDSVSR